MSNVSNKLIGHALTDCVDPDCEIHCPWIDENNPNWGCAIFVAGIKRGIALYNNELDEAQARVQEIVAQMRTIENLDELFGTKE
jgi:hypothetical protein